MCANSLAPHLRTMRFVGCYRVSDKAGLSRVRCAFYRAYPIFTMFATSLYLFLLVLEAVQVKTDLEKLPQILYVTLCYVNCLSKQVVFYIKADEIDDLIARLDDPLMNQGAGAGSELMQETTRSCARLLHALCGGAISTCMLWNAITCMNRIQGREVDFFFWVNYDHTFVFIGLMMFWSYVNVMGAVAQSSMDLFITTVLDVCKTQFRILSMNFETMPKRAEDLSNETDEPYEAVLQRLLVDCLQHYHKIIELCTMLNDIFSVPLLIQFGIGAWILCIAAVEIVDVPVLPGYWASLFNPSMDGKPDTIKKPLFSDAGMPAPFNELNLLSIEFASTLLFISCMITELFIFCYYGTRVTDESDQVSRAIYSMDWYRAPISFQRSLLVVMERAKRPLQPAAGQVMPLSLETYVKILKSSYSFYAVLRQTREAKS